MADKIVCKDILGEALLRVNDRIDGEVAYIKTEYINGFNKISADCDDFQKHIYAIQEKLSTLEANLRSVTDAMADKPKQKWLWEIFEPNDFDIDFSYIL